MRDNRGPLGSWLVGGLVVAAAWRPPELDGVGLFLATAFAAALGLVLVASGAGGWLTERSTRGSLLLLGLYLSASLLTSSTRQPAAAFLAGLVPAGLAFAASRRVARDTGGGKAVEAALVTAATGAALLGIYQALAGLERTARELRALGIAELDSLVIRAEGGRAFGPFLLPSALGIFMVLALPMTLRRMIESRSRPIAALAWGSLAVIQALGMAASRSYGAVLALSAAVMLLLLAHPIRRRAGLALLAIAVLATLTGLAIFAGRGSEGLSPLALRSGNWRAAIGIFREHPLLGVGFGNFRDYYPARMEPGMNESAYAHCSYLQAAAEGGIPALLILAAGAVALAAGCVRSAGSETSSLTRILTAAPILAFLIHNLVDFSAYLPSLLIPFAALAGTIPFPRRPDPPPAPDRPPPGWTVRALLTAALLGWAAMQMREARVLSILADARWAMTLGRVEEAVPLLERAAAIDPENPDPPAALGELLLASGPDDPDRRAKGERYARLATSLRPRRAFGHFLLSRYRLAGGDPSEAFVEAARARELFPSRRQYAEEAERLKETLRQSGVEGTPAHAP